MHLLQMRNPPSGQQRLGNTSLLRITMPPVEDTPVHESVIKRETHYSACQNKVWKTVGTKQGNRI